MKLKVLVFLTVMAFSLFFQSDVFSDELSDLRDEMRMMEERHQNEMSMMKERIDRLEAEAQAKSGRTGSAGADSPAASMEGATDLEGELVYLREQQSSLLNRLDRMVEFDLYATLEFENFEGSDSALDARNVELLADARMTDRLRVYAEIEFERASAVGEGRGAVEVEQGWLEYAINPYVNPRFGVVLVPFGRYNLEHFQPFQDLTDRPVAMSRVVPVTWAEAGAGFTGSTGLGDHLSINHQFFLINGLTNDFTDTSPRGARGSFEEDNNNNKAFVGRLAFTPVDVIPLETEMGLSGYWGEYDDADHEIGGFDVDWKFVKGPFELLGEYAFFDLEEGGIQSDELTAVPGFLSGYYVQFNYHFWFDVLNGTFLGRGFESPTFTAVVRYGQAHIDDDTDEDTGDNDEDQWVIGLNYRPVETWVLKLEYQMNQTDNESLDRGDSDGFISSVTAAF